jgi:hypothetical protein
MDQNSNKKPPPGNQPGAGGNPGDRSGDPGQFDGRRGGPGANGTADTCDDKTPDPGLFACDERGQPVSPVRPVLPPALPTSDNHGDLPLGTSELPGGRTIDPSAPGVPRLTGDEVRLCFKASRERADLPPGMSTLTLDDMWRHRRPGMNEMVTVNGTRQVNMKETGASTCTHECNHATDAWLSCILNRNRRGGALRVAFYVGQGRLWSLPQTGATRDVARDLIEGGNVKDSRFATYLAKGTKTGSNHASYLFEEWNAYISGARTNLEKLDRKDRVNEVRIMGGPIEFMFYSLAGLKAIKAKASPANYANWKAFFTDRANEVKALYLRAANLNPSQITQEDKALIGRFRTGSLAQFARDEFGRDWWPFGV